MAEYENEALGVKFTLPDRLNPFQQLAFDGRIAQATGGPYVRFWYGAVELIELWECESIPVLRDFNLHEDVDDAEQFKAIMDIVKFVANTTATHMIELEAVPKNV